MPFSHRLICYRIRLAFALAAVADKAKKLEVFSWWTSEGEAGALKRSLPGLQRSRPGVKIINAAVAGGGGSAARPILQTGLSGGNPPETWQTHPGWELLGQYDAT